MSLRICLVALGLAATFPAFAFNGSSTAGALPARLPAEAPAKAPGAAPENCRCRETHAVPTPEQAERRARQAERLASLTPEQIAERKARQAEHLASLTPEELAERRARQAARRALPACPTAN